VSVELVQEGTNICIYPNPTKNSITIDFGDMIAHADIQIYSIQGQLLQRYNTIMTNQTIIGLENYPSGLYMVVIKIEEMAPQAFKISKL
jgi:hypothetical protein